MARDARFGMIVFRVTLLTAAFLIGAALSVRACSASEYRWQQPSIDQWFYPAAISPGLRILGPTFSALGGPGTATGPARRGATLIGFGTSPQLPTGLLPAQYEIRTARMTVTAGPGTGNIQYDPSYDPIANLFSEEDDPGRPIELYGVGFRDNYDAPYRRLGLGRSDHVPPLFEEGTSQFSSGTGAYDLFPLGDDGHGNLTDVYSSPTGGYSALHEDPVDAWDTIPWAIGTVAGLRAGAEVPYETEFAFDVNLELPHVATYLQESLSVGVVGFFLSSLHTAAGHEGTVPYPQWYLKEHPFGVAPTLLLDVNLLPDFAPGDFNGDGQWTAEDLQQLEHVVHDPFDAPHAYDVNGDSRFDRKDVAHWVTDIRHTWFGDANLDGEFNSLDLVGVFQFGKYESNSSATWLEGDWNTDQYFDSSDMVLAFQEGGYESGPRNSVSSVPEPAALPFATIAMIGLVLRKRNHD